jgi:hypothetical protein
MLDMQQLFYRQAAQNTKVLQKRVSLKMTTKSAKVNSSDKLKPSRKTNRELDITKEALQEVEVGNPVKL